MQLLTHQVSVSNNDESQARGSHDSLSITFNTEEKSSVYF